MSFRGYERQWRRKEIERADRQREAQESLRRQRLGLAPREPARGSGMAVPSYELTSAGTITFAGTGGAFNDQMTTYHYQWTSNRANTLTDDELALRRVAPGDTREYEERAEPVKAECEPTLREIWRD